MGGPWRAIVGGAQQKMSFHPAQAIQLNNYSDQYGHLIEIDQYVVPGQVGMIVLADGATSATFKFEKPPGASQAAPTAGQICLITTIDEEPAGGLAPPLAPNPGVLLPIGLDSPQHLHAHSATHSHGASHNHGVTGTHVHLEGSHSHTLNIQAGAIVTGVGLDAGGQLVAAAGPQPVGTATDATNLGNTGATSSGPTDSALVGGTGAASPGNSDLENVQHTHP